MQCITDWNYYQHDNRYRNVILTNALSRKNKVAEAGGVGIEAGRQGLILISVSKLFGYLIEIIRR